MLGYNQQKVEREPGSPPLACKKGDFKRVIKEAVKNHADKIK
jgi:hypothetical protein